MSRGGIKLQAALDAFALDVSGLRCADLGCSVGGFTDCLLQAGAERVVAVDTAYGELAWKLRQDKRVEVRERTNALHTEPPAEGVDLVVIDLGWTRQDKAVPVALRWLASGGSIVSLIKPHYEATREEQDRLVKGVLADGDDEQIAHRTIDSLSGFGVTVEGVCMSPLRGSPKKNVPLGVGNREWLVWLRPV